jgi:DnaJ family protein C protein 7
MDKAGQFLARSESGDKGQFWKEISQEVNKDADWLFKMIGEAYAVLSGPTKRSECDLEEDMKKAPKESHRSNHYRRTSDFHGSPFQRSSNRCN